MRLTYRDAVTTVLAGAVVFTAFVVSSPRLAIVLLTVIGATMCGVGSRAADMATREELKRHPAMIVCSALGAFALAIVIVGLVAGTQGFVVLLAADLLLLWLIATARHALVPSVEAKAPVPA